MINNPSTASGAITALTAATSLARIPSRDHLSVFRDTTRAPYVPFELIQDSEVKRNIGRKVIRCNDSFATPTGSPDPVSMASAYLVLTADVRYATKVQLQEAYRGLLYFLLSTSDSSTSLNIDRIIDGE